LRGIAATKDAIYFLKSYHVKRHMMHLEDLIGSGLVFGIPGTKVTPDIVRHFKETHAGGIILYRINFESPGQIVSLICDLENALERRLLVTVDHEGGRVVMFRDGVTIFPDNLAFGTLGDAENARRQGEIEARELRALGMDVNFSPVLDVLTETYSPNIGIRAYGRDPHLVARLGVARVKAMQAGGLSATVKHFPGLGHAPVDAHLNLPVLPSTWPEMREIHLVPFIAAINSGVDVIMSSHPVFPHLDPTPRTPTTFSRRIMHDCLRTELEYKGVVSSDDLEMGAIRELCPMSEAAVQTAKAGHDLLLSCHDLVSQRQLYEALREAYRSKSLRVRDLEGSYERIDLLKAKRPQRFAPGSLAPVPEGPLLAREISQRAATVFKDTAHLLPLNPKKAGRVLVIFPALGSLASKIMIERELEDETRFLARCFSRHGLHIAPQGSTAATIVPIEPADIQIAQAAALAGKADITILFSFDAHWYSSNKKLLSSVQANARHLVVALMRDPYDVEFVRDGEACVGAFGFRQCQLEAVIDKIFQ